MLGGISFELTFEHERFNIYLFLSVYNVKSNNEKK